MPTEAPSSARASSSSAISPSTHRRVFHIQLCYQSLISTFSSYQDGTCNRHCISIHYRASMRICNSWYMQAYRSKEDMHGYRLIRTHVHMFRHRRRVCNHNHLFGELITANYPHTFLQPSGALHSPGDYTFCKIAVLCANIPASVVHKSDGKVHTLWSH